MWEPPFDEVQPPPGDAPLVLVAPSTAQDPEHRLLRAALAGLAGEPVRVLATWNRRPLPGPVRVPANARLVEWLSYAQTMPRLRAGHLPRRSRHPGPGPGVLVPGAGRAARRRHGRERRPAGLGGRGRPAPVAAARARHPAPGHAAGAAAARIWASERPSWVRGRPGIPGRREPPTSSSSSPRALTRHPVRTVIAPRAHPNLTVAESFCGFAQRLRSHGYRTSVESRIETPKYRATTRVSESKGQPRKDVMTRLTSRLSLALALAAVGLVVGLIRGRRHPDGHPEVHQGRPGDDHAQQADQERAQEEPHRVQDQQARQAQGQQRHLPREVGQVELLQHERQRHLQRRDPLRARQAVGQADQARLHAHREGQEVHRHASPPSSARRRSPCSPSPARSR